MCCVALREAPALPVAQRAGLYGQSNWFERIGFGTFDVDPAERVDQLLEAVEVDDDDVVHGRPVSSRTVAIASAGPPNW